MGQLRLQRHSSYAQVDMPRQSLLASHKSLQRYLGGSSNPKPQTLSSAAMQCGLTSNPKPQTLNPKPCSDGVWTDLKLKALNPKPQTLNPKP